MEVVSEIIQASNNSDCETFVLKQEISELCMDETSSSNETRSSWNSESDISNSGATLPDPFEGIIYRTHVSFRFVSFQGHN